MKKTLRPLSAVMALAFAAGISLAAAPSQVEAPSRMAAEVPVAQQLEIVPVSSRVATKKVNLTRYTSAATSQRTGASTKNKAIRTIPKGTTLKVTSTKSGWAKATYKSKSGWVLSKHLTTKKPVKKAAPKAKKVAPKKVSNSFTNRARTVLKRHGCGSAGIKVNDKRLGKYANGVADWYNNDVLLRSSMPAYRLEYVAAHECMHLRQAKAYGGNINALEKATNKVWGGRGFTGLERAADCMTRAKGIKVTNSAYKSSCKGKQATATKKLLAGKRI